MTLTACHRNWIGGAWASASGGTFSVEAAPVSDVGSRAPGNIRNGARGGTELGQWPRSSSAAAREALAAAHGAAGRWWALGIRGRRHCLERVTHELAANGDDSGSLGRRLGLTEAELAPHLERVGLPRVAGASGAARDTPAPGPALGIAHWSNLVAGTARASFELLLRGHTLVLLPDPKLPMVGDALAQALERADLPPGTVSILHDDGEATLQALLGSGELAVVVASGYAADLQRIAYRARTAAGLATAAGFGAGLYDDPVPAPVPELVLHTLSSATFVVPEQGELEALADHVAEHALGRSRTLSGQLPGQIGRVLCPERRFSGFTSELLARLEERADMAEPVPPVDPSSPDIWRRIRELGLDEGATLILGNGVPPGAGGPRAAGPADGAASSPRAVRDATFWGSVFTNVEAEGRLSRLSRPAPVLRLLRVGDEAAGHDLARRLAGRTEVDP